MDSDLFVLHCGGYSGLEVSELTGALEAEGARFSYRPSIPNVSRAVADMPRAAAATRRLALSFFACLELLFSHGDPYDMIGEIHRGIPETKAASLKVKVIRSRGAIPPAKVLELERKVGRALSAKMKAEVNLKNPEAEFILFVSERGFIFGRKIQAAARRDLNSRTNRIKPFKHPSTLQPDLSRALVNIARIRRGDTVIDPYCGVGGILLEISEIGATAVGLDFKHKMIYGARRNLMHYGNSLWHLIRGDARKPPFIKAEGIVTDPPYGRLSPRIGGTMIEELHDSFVAFSAEALSKNRCLSLICPSDFPMEAKLKRSGFKILSLNELRVHGGLTRVFISARR